ncbi:hypothetical protein VD0002_g4121 [Verticillium dahliae]|uniref:Major facilitator superfamily (MFS) profile domain-containing protein n=1 Tax=Verticillium dahliae TaxID=27337 RepID=A0AA45AHD8_VERDA|nr:hypothetical protein BJF96_g9227 [Verticillium dahliae]PNH64631.1 hypothetical protein VD0002_g4121 [Verticillium dahliae]
MGSSIHEEKAAQAVELDHAPDKDISMAQQSAEDEHNLTLREAIRRYPQAVLWSVLLSASIIMEGYDIVLISSFFTSPAFRRHYGEYVPRTGTYEITASWQNGLSNAVSVGTIIGAFANGYFTHKFGYRRVLLASLVFICGFIAISFLSPNLPVLIVGQFLCGIPWGVFATMAPAYASEVCPMALRGYLTVYVNLCWALGQLISAGVQAGFSGSTSQWAYRIPFAIQWAWPLPLFTILWFAPESPWYFIRVGKDDEAEKSVMRLGSALQRSYAKETVASMIYTNQLEMNIDEGTSYLDCFRGAGLPESISFRMSVGGLGIASVGTVASWLLLGAFGRRTLYLWGLALLTSVLMTVGFISVGAGDSSGGNYAQVAMMLLWLGIYYMTVGPICYAIISEVSSTRLRNKSVCLSRIAYYIGQIVCNVINPYMLNPTAGDWKGKTAFFLGGCAFAFFVWTFFRLPETKDKTFAELDILFEKKIGAREFSGYKVDAYAQGGESLVKKG